MKKGGTKWHHHIDIKQDEAMADDPVKGPVSNRSIAALTGYEHGKNRAPKLGFGSVLALPFGGRSSRFRIGELTLCRSLTSCSRQRARSRRRCSNGRSLFTLIR